MSKKNRDLKVFSDDISLNASVIIRNIRKFSEIQKNNWVRIPYLALQADGRSGYSDMYRRAYEQGYWAVETSVKGGSYTIYVDLETGNLVNAFDPQKPANGDDVLLLAHHLEQINSQEIVDALTVASQKPEWRDYKPEDQKKWREETQKEFNLKPYRYKRKIPPKVVYENNIVAGLVD
jgi:hypothetical protein